MRPTEDAPFYFQNVNQLESTFHAVAQWDVKSGRVTSLTLSDPILPGDGDGNMLLWSVSTDSNHLDDQDDSDRRDDSPSTVEEWEQIAMHAVQSWLASYSSELNIKISELFALGSVRIAVHDNGDMIQMHIPRLYNGVKVVGSRAMATIKLGNLVNIGLEEWGSIPEEFSVEPRLTVEDAFVALANDMELSLVSGVKCESELQILTLTPPNSNYGQGYEYVLVWKVCPLFEGQDVEVMEGLVDAQTGEVYSFIDKVHYFESRGGVFPISNDGRSPDGIEQVGWPMPYMYVGNGVTDTGGNYFESGSVTASFDGPYVVINDKCGSSSLSGSGGLDWGASGGTDCESKQYEYCLVILFHFDLNLTLLRSFLCNI